tara:strand:- start:3407 stop:3862 length:456 start_codon:yes stop_codon:yes gene_type:complete
MAFYSGRSGSLKYADKKVAKVRDWSLESTLELYSTTVLGSSYNTFVPGLLGATGSATILLYRLENEGTDANTDAFKVLLDSKLVNIGGNGATEENSKVRFTLNPSDRVGDKIEFNGYITSASISVATGELSTVAINFTVDDDFTNIPSRSL